MTHEDRELTANERERLNIWHDMMRMYNELMATALREIGTHPGDPILTMPMRELHGIHKRFTGLTARLQDVAGRDGETS